MQMTRELKIYPEYFYGVVTGVKKAELRRTDDRTFNTGDLLVLHECTDGKYTGQQIAARITDVSDVTQFVGKPMALLSFELCD
ncbi:DUF3850 domain-containing protein [Salmonella virus VSiP]|uniref:DUF3850 domain-containing protein n=1 Tax=Salmonella virus VSiP TaxID=2301721 RepID=A0A385EGW3_9CAUD|nr:DUF3850 domain-containing protein [Salmonella virus VSiP]AXQ70222.1 DUF3850 domain-containing protein [Salmonella virus VSiP]QFR58948.1 DUF3850 domain-containing protein [Salmonella virus VSiA]